MGVGMLFEGRGKDRDLVPWDPIFEGLGEGILFEVNLKVSQVFLKSQMFDLSKTNVHNILFASSFCANTPCVHSTCTSMF